MIKVFPVPGAMCREPGTSMVPGQPPRYVGRAFVPDDEPLTPEEARRTDGSVRVRGAFQATGEPYQCEDVGERAEQIRRYLACGDLIPADKYTADLFGIKLQKVRLEGGEMVPVPAESKKEPS